MFYYVILNYFVSMGWWENTIAGFDDNDEPFLWLVRVSLMANCTIGLDYVQ